MAYERTSEGEIKFGKWVRTFIRKLNNNIWIWFIQDMKHWSTVSKMIIKYNLFSFIVNASSVSSVKSVIIWENLDKRVLKTWTVILLSCKKIFFFFSFMPISERRFHLTHKSENKTLKFSPLKTNKTLKMDASRN